ncbi:MAG: hypothetical protein KAI74_01870 [Kiritimatiellae bacterium]|nr:hypothetical protein [Kiritimatiellia bacterium]
MKITNRKLMNQKTILFFSLAFLSVVSVITACNIPVFRYALERWCPDYYTCYVFHRGALDADAKEIATEIDEKYTVNGVPLNLACRFVDLNKKHPKSVMKLYVEHVKGNRLPIMVVSTPENYSGNEKVFWIKPFTKESLMQVVDSPTRVALYEKIMHGESAVWVLFTSGDKKRDDAARAVLSATISNLMETCEVPEGVIPVGQEVTHASEEENKLELGIPLKISFSMMEVSQQDPAEAFFTESIRSSSDNMTNGVSGPFIVPVFGQGRVAASVTERDMSVDNMTYLGYYISAACSCQAKAQNIGFDLLMLGDWSKFDNQLVQDRKLPPVAGAGALITEDVLDIVIEKSEIVVEKKTTEQSKILLGIIAGTVILLVIGTIAIKKKDE